MLAGTPALVCLPLPVSLMPPRVARTEGFIGTDTEGEGPRERADSSPAAVSAQLSLTEHWIDKDGEHYCRVVGALIDPGTAA